MVELDAVAVGGNVAARHHDGRERLVDAVKGDGRARDTSAVDDLPRGIFAGLHERLQDAFGTRAQVARDRDGMFALVAYFAVPDKGAGVHVAYAVGHRRYQSAGSAGAECHAGLLHYFLHRNAHKKPLFYPRRNSLGLARRLIFFLKNKKLKCSGERLPLHKPADENKILSL